MSVESSPSSRGQDTYLNIAGSNSCDTDTSDRGHERVGGRNVSRVSGTPHDPGRSTSGRTSKCKQLHSSVSLEGLDWNNTVLDRRSSPGTDGQGTGHFEYQTQNHGLLVCDGAGRDTRGPGVGDIVGTIVVRLKQCEERANGKDVGVLLGMVSDH